MAVPSSARVSTWDIVVAGTKDGSLLLVDGSRGVVRGEGRMPVRASAHLLTCCLLNMPLPCYHMRMLARRRSGGVP